MRKALVLYENEELFALYRQNAMRADFSWERTAGEYVRVYEQALNTNSKSQTPNPK